VPVVRKSANWHNSYSRKLLIVPLMVTLVVVVLLCAAGWQGGQRQERPTCTPVGLEWHLYLPLVQKPECERLTPAMPRATPTGEWGIH